MSKFNRSSRKGHDNGFTLVELLVVIGIIAVLISILLPSLARARQAANTLACLSNLKQIGTAIFMYAESNGGFMPVNQDANRTWNVLVAPYVGGTDGTYDRKPQVFRCPSASIITEGELHYTSNPLLIPDITRSYSGNSITKKFTKSYKITQLRPDSTELAIIFDGTQMLSQYRKGRCEGSAWMIDGYWMGGYGWGTLYRRTNSTNMYTPIGLRANVDDVSPVNGAYPPAGDIRYREMGETAVNLLFGDGHAETFARGSVLRAHLRPYEVKTWQ